MSTRSGKQYRPKTDRLEGFSLPDMKPRVTKEQLPNKTPAEDPPNQDVASSKSGSSKRSSRGSTTSSAALRARAKVKAARAKMSFVEQEAELIRQRAQFEANMLLLQSQKAAAAALAEAAVYEEAEEEAEVGDHEFIVQLRLQEESPIERAHEYVERHFNQPTERNQPTTFEPSTRHQELTELAKYLVRKDLVSARLTKFDERPENYRSWKASFRDVIKDLCLSCREELDLLIKWLGEDSSTQAKRLRSVNVTDPQTGLAMVWERLEEEYGAPEVIEQFPRLTNKDKTKMRELGDILLELECAKSEGTLPGLAYLDTSRGVSPIVEKLPYGLQEKWMAKGAQYKEDKKVAFPPFSLFSKFVRQQAKIRNDPSFAVTTTTPFVKSTKPVRVNTHLTEATEQPDIKKQCPIHKKPHPLHKCRAFLTKSLYERKAYLRENKLCFRCLGTSDHMARDCKEPVKCTECGSEGHLAALHTGPPPIKEEQTDPKDDGGEEIPNSVNSKCTEICGETLGGHSCSKICLVKVYPEKKEHEAIKAYAVLDEQSNRSLAKTQLFDIFDIESKETPYTLKTCSGTRETAGRRANNLMIQSIDDKTQLHLPSLIECERIPDDRTEIPSPHVALRFPHLKPIANKLPPVDPEVPILLLLGRDILQVHKVREHINGPHDAPYAQRLDLGWVIVGETCLGTTHKPKHVNVFKSNIMQNGRSSVMKPCPNKIQVKDKLRTKQGENSLLFNSGEGREEKPQMGSTVFIKTKDDEKQAPSVEDQIFLDMMDKEVYRDEANSWVAPLPFRPQRRRLPNNRDQAQRRLRSLSKSLEKNPVKKDQFVQFVRKMLENGHAELAPPLDNEKERWYLPMFGVHHPQKPDQIRVVFDSSAEFEGVSLNDILLSGPDLNNSLPGVLIRFRREPVAFMADVQQMFYCFSVKEDHRDFLRFLWYKDNDMNKEVTEYRMKVHVFGNSPSPSVAVYCMRRAAQEGEKVHGGDAKQFVERNFYVDDGLHSVDTSQAAINLLTKTRKMLAESNLNLHKIASNSSEVMKAFDAEDRAKGMKGLELSLDPLPLQRSLGLLWDLERDSFTFNVSPEQKAFTRRGVLSTINSLYDPLGLAAPITLKGKILLRELSPEITDWDAPLSVERESEWNEWRQSLKSLKDVHIPRCYTQSSLSSVKRKELCIFSDASTVAVGTVAYLKVVDYEGQCRVGFVMGKSKLAPKPAHTIPRLELCAAVLAVELAEYIQDEIDTAIDAVRFYTDSRIVLGYINNNTRRFYVYVANRVNRIRKSSHPSQWRYVSTKDNPADMASRSIPASDLPNSTWFSGPEFLSRCEEIQTEATDYDLIEPESDTEVRPVVSNLLTKTAKVRLGSHRFERFSSWKTLSHVMARLIQTAKSFRKIPGRQNQGTWKRLAAQCSVNELTMARTVIIRCVQQEAYGRELLCLEHKLPLSKQSPLRKVNPFIDETGILRVGGRLSSAELSREEKHPVIVPSNHHVSTLIVRHYHEHVAHQGRHISEGAVRAAGYWIIGGKRLVSSVIHKCVTCRKLRGKQEVQIMANLPADRLSPEPPFTSVGLDVFGPWDVLSRKTRGGSAESKRWAVIFSCMSTRAVHIEVIESLSTSSFINSLRRFFAVRGPAKVLRSDRGTNFVGACKELDIVAESTELKNHLKQRGCVWLFNPPHSSHMGGSWERMIGIARRILNAMLLQSGRARLTHEVLITLMAEVMAIMNARPLVPVSTESDEPAVLTPAMLLTQKIDITSAPKGNFDTTALQTKQWKHVQCLAETFWKRWRREYLSTLQGRRKWADKRPNLKQGDVVLLKDTQVTRNEWPIGLIDKALPSSDGKVRKVEVKIIRDGKPKVFLRPVTEVLMLISSDGTK